MQIEQKLPVPRDITRTSAACEDANWHQDKGSSASYLATANGRRRVLLSGTITSSACGRIL
jgi:hypothetical protein